MPSRNPIARRTPTVLASHYVNQLRLVHNLLEAGRFARRVARVYSRLRAACQIRTAHLALTWGYLSTVASRLPNARVGVIADDVTYTSLVALL